MSKKDDILRTMADEAAEINFDNLKKRDSLIKKNPFSASTVKNHAIS